MGELLAGEELCMFSQPHFLDGHDTKRSSNFGGEMAELCAFQWFLEWWVNGGSKVGKKQE